MSDEATGGPGPEGLEPSSPVDVPQVTPAPPNGVSPDPQPEPTPRTGEPDPVRAPARETTGEASGKGQTTREQLLLTVQDIRSNLQTWTEAVTDAIGLAGSVTPDVNVLEVLVGSKSEPRPAVAATRLEHRELLGPHAELLASSLEDAGRWWAAAAEKVGDPATVKAAIPLAQQAVAALERAMQHAVYLTFLGDATEVRVGRPYDISSYGKVWGLTEAQVDEVWLWLNQDPLRFGTEKLPLVLDTQNRCVYRRAGRYGRWWYAAAPLWGAALAFGLVALLFFVLQKAGLTSWPRSWGWKMVVLFVFVALGALLHVGANVVNVNYDNPLKVYDAGGIVDWLSLRWIAVLRLYIPVIFVAASLWGAKNIPGSFRALGTAILAGYGADSVFRTAVSSVQAQSSKKHADTASAAHAAGTPPTSS